MTLGTSGQADFSAGEVEIKNRKSGERENEAKVQAQPDPPAEG